MANVKLDRKLEIVIVGGSLASLFTAIPLSRLPQQHRITILERTPQALLHSTGAGIVTGAQTLEWFQIFDGSSRGKPDGISVQSNQRLYLDRTGKVIDREDRVQRMTSWEMAYYLGRWNADGLRSGYVNNEKDDGNGNGDEGLTEQRGQIEYRYGCLVEGIQEKGDRVVITYENLLATNDGEDRGTKETIEADFLIVADGPSSRSRRILLGVDAKERHYAGYVAFRGTAKEVEISQAARDVFVERFTFFHGRDPKTQILGYTIPGPDGSLDKNTRLVNWVWYWNVEGGSDEYKELMTDTEGNVHRLTLPTGGKMRPEIWEKQKQLARENLPPQFVELIEKTASPFIQAITDLEPPPEDTKLSQLLGGKAIIVGDALSGFRAHTAASTSQAAYHGLLLDQVFQSKMSWTEYEQEVLRFAWAWQVRGVMLGNRSQFGEHPLVQ